MEYVQRKNAASVELRFRNSANRLFTNVSAAWVMVKNRTELEGDPLGADRLFCGVDSGADSIFRLRTVFLICGQYIQLTGNQIPLWTSTISYFISN